MDLLYRAAADQEVNWGNAESEIAGFSGVRVVHPEVSIVAAKPMVNISTTLGIVTSMQTTGAAIDALSRISSAIPITSDTGVSTQGFMYLSGYEGSYLEEKAFEDVLGVESISTMKLLRIAAGQGISIVTINQQNISSVLPTITTGLDVTSTQAIQTNIENLVNQGLEVQIPSSGTTYQAFTGTGYIALNLTTGEGGYYLSGNLHGGMTVLPLIEWPPDIGLPLINEYINVVKPDNDPNAVTQLRLITPNWAVSTVGKFLDNPIQVQALDSKGVPVIGATITFQIKNGGGCLAPNDTFSSLPPNLQPQPSCTDLDITVNGTTNYVGEASAEFKLGKYTNADPIYYKMTDLPSEEVTLAGLNNLNIVSQNNIGLASGYTAIGMPDKPATLTGINNAPYDIGRLAAYSGYVVGNVVDQYNNPVSNVPVVFSAATNYLGTNSSDPLFQSNYEPMAIVSWKNAGVVQGCPATPSQDNVQACEGGPVITIPTTFKGADGYVITGNVCDAI